MKKIKKTDDCYKLFVCADSLWEKGDNKAFGIMLQLANAGYKEAQGNLGVMYETGFGTEIDLEQALFWYKESWINNEDIGSCLNISDLYFSLGEITDALFWLNKAVEKGDSEAKMAFVGYKMKYCDNNKAELVSLLDEVTHSTDATIDSIEVAKRMVSELENID